MARIIDHPLIVGGGKRKRVPGMQTLQPGTLAIAKAKTGNEKLGDSATTYAEQRSCPTSCVFFDGGGCYAEDGPVGKFVTQPLNRAALAGKDLATPEEIAQAEADALDHMSVERDYPLRLHTVGDCKTTGAAQIVAAAALRYMQRGGGPVWTYTHAWRDVPRWAWHGVDVLASCETPEDVKLAHERGYATAITVEEFQARKLYGIGAAEVGHLHAARRPAGAAGMDGGSRVGGTARDGGVASPAVSILPCPAQTTAGVTCSSCRLCMNSTRLREQGITIGFAIHGTALLRRRATAALRTPDDPDRKLSSRVLIPRVEAELRAKLGRRPTNPEIAEVLGCSVSSVWEMRTSIEKGMPTRKWSKSRRGER